MSFEESGSLHAGFAREQTIAWVEATDVLLATPIEQLDHESQQALAARLRSQVLRLFRDPGSSFYVHGNTTLHPQCEDSEVDRDLADWDTLKTAFFDSNLHAYHRYFPSIGSHFESQVHDAITVAAALERWPEVLMAAAEARSEIMTDFEDDKAKYGNKYANLQATAHIVQRLNTILSEAVYEVPAFIGVPIDVYAAFSRGDLRTTDLQSYMAWIEQNATSGYWVRSSAVNSEDSETSTAAGVYQSVFVPAGQGTTGLSTAMREVYASVESEEGVRYRAEHGVENEVMGLVIQTAVPRSEGTTWGYSNSIVPGVAALQEVYATDRIEREGTETLVRQLLWRDKTLLDLTHPPHRYGDRIWWDAQADYSSAPYFDFDRRRGDPITFLRASYLSRFTELVYDRPVQQEFMAGDSLYVLQTRALPAIFTEAPERFHGFPDRPYYYSGRALGIANAIEGTPIEEKKVERGIPNDGRPYIVVIESNFTASRIEAWMLKGSQAVVVVDDHIARDLGGRGAHLETLCAEMGIPCSFATYIGPEGEAEHPHTVFQKLVSLDKITIFMDGLQSRVY